MNHDEHGRKWSPFHPFRGRGWRRSQSGVGHKMRREKKKGKKKKKRGKRKKGREKREAFYRLIEALQISLRPFEAH